MKHPESILYVCCGGKCKKRGSKHIYKGLKSTVKEKHLKKRIKVIRTSCTDNCKHGPVVTVMPQNQWWTHVDDEKAKALLEKVVTGLQ